VGGGTLLLELLWFLVLLLSKGIVDLKLVLMVYCCLWNIQVGDVAYNGFNDDGVDILWDSCLNCICILFELMIISILKYPSTIFIQNIFYVKSRGKYSVSGVSRSSQVF